MGCLDHFLHFWIIYREFGNLSDVWDDKAEARKTTDGEGERGASATTCTACARNEKAVTVTTVTAELVPKQMFELPEAEATVEAKPADPDIRKWPMAPWMAGVGIQTRPTEVEELSQGTTRVPPPTPIRSSVQARAPVHSHRPRVGLHRR